jgi:glutaryl-CoA dehydrogenase
MATYQAALDYAKSRKQWRDRPIAAHQLVQERLAWMITEITQGAASRVAPGSMKNAGTMKPHHVSMAKRNNVWVRARDAPSLPARSSAQRRSSRDTRCSATSPTSRAVYTYEGTHDIHTLVIGEAVTGVPSYNPPME